MKFIIRRNNFSFVIVMFAHVKYQDNGKKEIIPVSTIKNFDVTKIRKKKFNVLLPTGKHRTVTVDCVGGI